MVIGMCWLSVNGALEWAICAASKAARWLRALAGAAMPVRALGRVSR
jgi:hypothetical protein